MCVYYISRYSVRGVDYVTSCFLNVSMFYNCASKFTIFTEPNKIGKLIKHKTIIKSKFGQILHSTDLILYIRLDVFICNMSLLASSFYTKKVDVNWCLIQVFNTILMST